MTGAPSAAAPLRGVGEACWPLLARELDRIAATAPFDEIPASRLAGIFAEADILFFRHRKIICHPEIAESGTRLWVVRQGSVHAAPHDDGQSQASATELLRAGAIFPFECALSGAPALRVYSAAEDSSLWEISGEVLQALLSEPAVLRWIVQRLQEAKVSLRQTGAEVRRGRQASDQALALPASTAGSEEIVFVPTQTVVGEVAALMGAQRVGASPKAITGRAAGLISRRC